jgi:predicted MFS family arabinose efflux permease
MAAFAYVIYMAIQWMSEPGMFTLLMNKMSPEERSGASALTFLVMSLSQSFAAATAGASFTRFGYPAVLSVTAVVALAAAGVSRLLLGGDSPQFVTAKSRQLESDSPQKRRVVDQVSLP